MAPLIPCALDSPPPPPDDFGLRESDFDVLGEFSAAGLRAAHLVLARAATALADGRVPIAGAVVIRRPSGELHELVVGQNGRVPPCEGESLGYPTDHGETAAIRQVQDPLQQDWASAVFATSLSPCVMCFRCMEWLWRLGLRHVVVAESQSFGGTSDRIVALPGMVVARLCNRRAVAMMRRFARTYPWDWAADIGAVPPSDTGLLPQLRADGAKLGRESLQRLRDSGREAAVLVPPDGQIAAAAEDGRKASGGNEVRSAAMVAMGSAGSAVNLREAVVAVLSRGGSLSLETFGCVSLGACELFKPAALLTDAPVERALEEALRVAGVEVLVVLPEKAVA